MIQQNETAVQARRHKAEIVVCPHCGELVCQDATCSNCAAIFSMEGLIDLLVTLKVRQADPPMAA